MRGGLCIVYLTFSQRKEIERLYGQKMRPVEIAAALGVAVQTIYHELDRGDTGKLDAHYDRIYSAELGEMNFKTSLRRRGRRRKEATE